MAVVFAVITAAGYLILTFFVGRGLADIDRTIGEMVVALFSGLLCGFVYTLLFNSVARRTGGIEIHLTVAPELREGDTEDSSDAVWDPLAPIPPTSEKKECPSCGAMVRADRSFCLSCDHLFDSDEEEDDEGLEDDREDGDEDAGAATSEE